MMVLMVTLSFTVDGTADGSIALTEGVGANGNVGTDGGCEITADTDPYAGQQGEEERFWGNYLLTFNQPASLLLVLQLTIL